jgi:type I restriction enzyme S subunit
MTNKQLKKDNCQLPIGYKQTEVGLIPNDWEITTFDMIADKNKKWNITGGPFGSNLKVSDYTLNGVQIVQLQNIGDGIFIDDSQIYTSEEKANELLSCNIYPNEIIISKMGDPVARACFIPNKAKRYLMASDGIRLVVNEKEFSKKFIHDYINSVYFRKRAFENSRGSTRLRIGLPELKSLLVIKPKLAEQTAIATALSDADALISSLEKLIAKKRNIKQGAMQKLLQPKEGWEVKKLGEIGKCHRGVSYNPDKDLHPHDKDITIRLLRSNNIQNRNLDFEGLQFVDAERVKQNQILQENDIVICMANGSKQLVGKSAIFNDKGTHKYTFGAFMGCFRTDANLALSAYVALNFQSFQYRNYIDVLLSGSSINNLNPSNIESISIPFPSPIEQIEISNILTDMENEITALKTKLEKYRKVKLGMMQELLTGKIRLVCTNK